MEAMTEDRTKYLLNEKGIRLLFEAAFEFIDDFSDYDSGDNGAAILAAIKASVKTEMSLNEFQRLFKQLVSTRRVTKNEEREAEEQAEQEALAEEERRQEETEAAFQASQPTEFELFYEQQPASAIRERIRTDRKFAEFARARIVAESQKAEGVQNTHPASEPHNALKRFAAAYRVASASSLRPVNGNVTVGTEKFSFTKFQEFVAAASAAGLL